jgi:hypothetical protein
VIRYTLRCDQAHEFEGWFRSSADYDKAHKKGATECPMCGSRKVEKALMAPAVSGTDKGAETVRLAAPDPRETAFREMLKALRKHVTENAEYVGNRFADEARKIHYDEAEARGIYGEATRDEAESLAEEGIGFHPLPVLPDEHN